MEVLRNGYKRAIFLWHRRGGKDVCLWNLVVQEAVTNIGIYFYLLPTYEQAKRVIWNGRTNDTLSFFDFIPPELLADKNISELKVTLINGSIIQLIGTDRYDGLRGTNPRGIVFSEYAYHNPMAWEVIKPILKLNGGWAIFNTTPNGKNHCYDLWEFAKNDPEWFTEMLTIEDTGLLTEADMEAERRAGMTDDMVRQEYYVDFSVGMLGAIYVKWMNEALDNGRVKTLVVDKLRHVDVWFDLGKGDSTSMIFTQANGDEIRIVDFYEAHGEEVAHYVDCLDNCGYRIGTLNLPHDAVQKRLESPKTVQEQFETAGYSTRIIPASSIENGIQEVRKIFPRLYFDEQKTQKLIKAINNYQYEYDPKLKMFRSIPQHNWASHANDALRYLAVGWKEETNSYTVAVEQYLRPTPQSPRQPLVKQVKYGQRKSF